ncbi:MAG: hypothetical protein CMJ31_00985 [Phycisphaerae bacterium]|nr:hypothetical protein [Phycisphaerae bacterium]
MAAAPTLWFANADLVAASRLERCDWQSSVELGVRCSLPHTYVMGDVLQLLVVQGFACEEIDGDVDTALISWAAALRAAEHLASGGTFVESRIAMRWAQRIVAIVEQRIDFEDVSAESLTDWSHALGRFDAEDPFGTLLAIERAVEWGVRISALDVLEAERIEQNGLVGYSFDDTPVLPRSDAEAEKLRRLTIAARPWKAAMREAWLRPSGDLGDDHAAAERAAGFVNAVTAEARSGEFGDAGRLMLVNDYGAVRSEELRATRSIGRARAAVRKARAE